MKLVTWECWKTGFHEPNVLAEKACFAVSLMLVGASHMKRVGAQWCISTANT